ncbi:MAG: hypothetical protein ACREHD_32765 [Pirellulales bacterium]
MASQETQTADAQARVTLPVAFAETKVIVEMLSPSEVRIRKVDEATEQSVGSDDLMRLAEVSGAFDFWKDPAEDIYGPDDGESP